MMQPNLGRNMKTEILKIGNNEGGKLDVGCGGKRVRGPWSSLKFSKCL